MNRFFVNTTLVEGGKISLLGEDYNHIRNVFRMGKGEKIEIVTPECIYVCRILDYVKSAVICEVINERTKENELPSHINIFQGMPKKDKMELIIQKSVELGAYSLTPVVMDRTVVKVDDKKMKARVDRWNKISKASAMQSKRDIIPEVYPPIKLREASSYLTRCDLLVVLYENEVGTEELKSILPTIHNYGTINVVVGPEGGISDDEMNYLKGLGAKSLSLGRRTLRTETASLAFLSCAGLFLEN